MKDDKAQFEDNFIARTYRNIVSDPTVAMAELVANSWDAGATRVDITVPNELGGNIIVEDNGNGMTHDEFRNRWMIIGYNRIEHQGEYVSIVSNINSSVRRRVYGKNGVGRHGLFCFNNKYSVETWRDGVRNKYTIALSKGDAPFAILKHEDDDKNVDGNGTKLIVAAKNNFLVENEISNTLGYKFIFDPLFEIYVNGNRISNPTDINPEKREQLNCEYGEFEVEVYSIPEGEKSVARSGVAIWVLGRLVGKPSWTVGDFKLEDGRRKFANKHAIIVKADFLMDSVLPDWTGFSETKKINSLATVLSEALTAYKTVYNRERNTRVRDEVIRRQRTAISRLSEIAKERLSSFFDNYLQNKPEIEAEDLDTIVLSLVNVLSNERGVALLDKLSKMSGENLDALDRMLEKWSATEIKTVLDEIDMRISVVDAIQKLSSDPKTDELHVLHPLLASARWLFGVEYDTINYTYNKSLSTVIEGLLCGAVNEEAAFNWKKRPDLVITPTSSVAVSTTEDFDDNDIAYVDRILIIELKRGGFHIGRNEITQAEEYVDALYRGRVSTHRPKIKAYVVGYEIENNISCKKKLCTNENVEYAEITAYTYDQLASTACKRLFNLNEKLKEHYEKITKDNYLEAILKEPQQMPLF